EDEVELAELRGDGHRDTEADEHRDAAEAGGRARVHITCADRRGQTVPDAELPDEDRETEGDTRRERARQQVIDQPHGAGSPGTVSPVAFLVGAFLVGVLAAAALGTVAFAAVLAAGCVLAAFTAGATAGFFAAGFAAAGFFAAGFAAAGFFAADLSAASASGSASAASALGVATRSARASETFGMASRTSLMASSGMTPWRTIRMLPPGRRSPVASTMVEPVPSPAAGYLLPTGPPSRYTMTLSPSIRSASCAV